MRGVLALVVIVLVSVVGVEAAGAANATAGSPPPSLATVQAAATAPGTVISSSVRPVSVAEAVAASFQPGGDTEVSQLGPSHSIGVVVTPNESEGSPASTCWNGDIGYQWGTWPYQQVVQVNTSWCGNGSVLTYRSTYVTTGAYLCNGHDAFGYKIGGGVGTGSEVERTGAYFDCQTPVPYVSLHYTRQMNVIVGAGGAYYLGWNS